MVIDFLLLQQSGISFGPNQPKTHMEPHSSNGFVVGSQDLTYDAQVKSVKNDRVTFMVTNFHGERLSGTFYLPRGCRINPHVIFKTGAFWQVKVVHISKRIREKGNYSYPELNIEVIPQQMPVDLYVEDHPPGSVVIGEIVDTIKKGALLLVRLAKNVYCTIKNSKAFCKGMTILCKITEYDGIYKTLTAEAV